MPLERRIQGGEVHAYGVRLGADEYLNVRVEQRGVDLVVECVDPEGRTLVEADSPKGSLGPEVASLVSGAPGTYRVLVRSLAEGSAPGSYVITRTAPRRANAEDRRRADAEKTQTEAYRHSRERTAESLRQAVAGYRRALAQWRTLGDRKRQAEVLHRLGVAHRLLGENELALDVLEQALAVHGRDDDLRGQAEVWNQVGLVHWSRNEQEAGMAAYTAALALWRTLADPAREARTLNNLGLLHHAAGRFDEALAVYRRALELFRETADRRREAIALNNIGGILDARGELVAALERYEEALTLAQGGDDRRRQADALNNIGSVQVRLGKLQEALDGFRTAVALFRVLGDRRREAAAASNLGDLYLRLGQPERALEQLSAAYELHKSLEDRRGQARDLDTLGRAHALLGQTPLAVAMYRGALDLQREIGDQVGESVTLRGLGAAYVAAGEEPALALPYLNRALELRQAQGHPAGQARCLLEIGLARAALGELDAASAILTESLRGFQELGDRYREALSLRELARVEMELGHLEAAQGHAQPALELAESLRTEIAAEELRTSYFEFLHETYELFVELMMRRDRRRPGSGFDVLAFETAERARSRSLHDLLREGHVDPGPSVDAGLLDELRGQQLEINAKAYRLRQERARPGNDARAVERELGDLLGKYQDLKAEVRLRDPRYAELTQPTALSLPEIQSRCLDEETQLLEFALGKERGYLWSVTTSSIAAFELPSRRRVESAVREAHELLSRADPRAASRRRKALAELGRTLLPPTASSWERPRLVVVADGALQYVPFGVLPHPTDPAVPLVARHEIVSLPSMNVLAELRRAPRRATPAAALAVFADPVFEADDPRVMTAGGTLAGGTLAGGTPAGGTPAGEPLWTEPGRAADGAGVRLRRLPWSRREAEDIVALVGESSPEDQVYLALDFDSRREAATSTELANFRVIHFATHGFFDSRHPELSGLVLSLVDSNGRPRDGFLRLHDVYDLELNAELVVLSGCRTALGKQIRGEGLLSLSRGFFYAGAPRVVASLWSVEDRATAELMTHFYRALFLGGSSPAAALREAQVAIWRDQRFRDPYFWGAFVFQGDWRPRAP